MFLYFKKVLNNSFKVEMSICPTSAKDSEKYILTLNKTYLVINLPSFD